MNQIGIRFVRSTLIVTMKILGKLDFSRLIEYCWLVLEWTIKGTNVEPVEGPKRFIVNSIVRKCQVLALRDPHRRPPGLHQE